MPIIVNQNNPTISNKKKENNETFKLNFDLRTLDTLCRYVLQPKSAVRLEHIMNLNLLFSLIDGSVYQNDPEKLKRIRFINKVIEARIQKNITDRDMLIMYTNGGLDFPVEFLDYDRLDLSRDDTLWLHDFITESIRYSFVYNSIEKMTDLCTRFRTSDFEHRGGIINEYAEFISDTQNKFRKAKIEENINEAIFSLRDDRFTPMITNTYNIVTSPSRRLISGMQGLNEMTGGGFEAGRVYMFLGIAGVGKSMTLLNLLLQMKRYNTYYDLKDKTKTPAIVLLTMENTVVETLTRLFDMVVSNSKGMENYDLDDVLFKLRNEGQLIVNESSPIDIVIKYKPNKSVDTNYLYALYDDLKDLGYEMVCLIQDHIKRIRSADHSSELRIELGDIVNEFKVFGADKEIPIITVSHLNRDAVKLIEEQSRKGNQDLGKLLGNSNMGESLLMADNADMTITLTKDYDKDGLCYMTFHRVKMRDKGSKRDYICQPFVAGGEIRLVTDIGTIPQFKESIHTNQINNTTSIKMAGSSSMTNVFNNVIDLDDLDDTNTFTKESFTLELKDDIDSNDDTSYSNDIIDIANSIINDINRPHDMRNVEPVELVQKYEEPVQLVTFAEPMVAFDI